MADFTKWKRKDFGDPFGAPPKRSLFERETNEDIQKPIQQILCDVREQASMKGLPHGTLQRFMLVRMASMIARVALEHERSSRVVVWLTVAVVVLTVVLVVLTIGLLWLTWVLAKHDLLKSS